MPAPENILKRRLNAGEVTHGIWLGMADAYAAEIAGTAGFDWLLIDGEHAPNGLRSTLAQLAVLAGSGAAPVVRLPDGDPTRIKQALDIGAQTLLIPMVDSADKARMMVKATRYPPEGFRGVGSALARASRFSAIPDYLTTADDQICLILQVESARGVAALDDILQVDGVDGVFVGPADLAADMGHLGNPGHPDVRAAVLDCLTRIRASGRSAGVLSTDPAFVADCTSAGANFVGVGIDVTLYSAALRELVRKYRAG